MKSTIYRTELENIAQSIADLAETEIRGSGLSSFVYAHTSDRAIELSKTEHGVWVEFWQTGLEPPEHEQTFDSYDAAASVIRDWFDATKPKQHLNKLAQLDTPSSGG